MFTAIQFNVKGNSLSNKHAQLIHLFKLIDETLKVQLINGYGMSILITLDLSFALLADKMNLQAIPAFVFNRMKKKYKEISLKAEAKIAIQFKIDDRQNKTHHHHHDDHEIEANGRLEILQVTYC